ncbi:MAG: type II secretion system protein GspC [Gammaproteobacteria bacterium]
MSTLALQQTDLARWMQGKGMRRLIWIINLLLVVWIASQLARLTWDLLTPQETATPLETQNEVLQTNPDPDSQLIGQLASWHLLGEVKQAAAPVMRESPIDAPETTLKLVLHGSLASDDPRNARAIIAEPRGTEEQYAVGDKLPGNAELREIYTDRVILMRNGRYETLRLPRDKKDNSRSASRAAVSRSSASSTQRLQNIRQQLQQNPKTLFGLVRAQPKRGAGGKMVGYTLNPGREPELFQEMGLLAGDVVTQVNDISLNNVANGARALKSAQSGETVSVTILRNGQEQVLSLNIPE